LTSERKRLKRALNSLSCQRYRGPSANGVGQ
jgi:hypothetical protein